jgi:hypothetical protein
MSSLSFSSYSPALGSDPVELQFWLLLVVVLFISFPIKLCMGSCGIVGYYCCRTGAKTSIWRAGNLGFFFVSGVMDVLSLVTIISCGCASAFFCIMWLILTSTTLCHGYIWNKLDKKMRTLSKVTPVSSSASMFYCSACTGPFVTSFPTPIKVLSLFLMCL